MSKFNTDWHGVPAGTEVRAVRSYIDCQGEHILVVERVDGLPLPCPWDGEYHRANVASRFIAVDA